MPLASIHLFSLSDPKTLPSLLTHIKSQNVQPLTLSKPIRWIIRPEHITAKALLEPRWDLLLIIQDTPSSQELITSLLSTTSSSSPSTFQITNHFTLQTGIPSRLLKSFHETINPSLLHPNPKDIPPLTGALKKPLIGPSSQTLALSPELQSWIGTSPTTLPIPGAVSMLNFLSFKPGEKSNYLKYGAAFAETIGSKRGGNAKLVGNIVGQGQGQGKGEREGEWHEFALAHYPSLLHFADMLGSEDYQSVNEKYRVPSLGDTCILCTSELEIEKIVAGEGGLSAKL